MFMRECGSVWVCILFMYVCVCVCVGVYVCVYMYVYLLYERVFYAHLLVHVGPRGICQVYQAAFGRRQEGGGEGHEG